MWKKNQGRFNSACSKWNTFRQTLWRIIPVSRWLETSIYKPYECFQQRRYPRIIHFFIGFSIILFSPSILGHPYFLETPKKGHLGMGSLATPDQTRGLRLRRDEIRMSPCHRWGSGNSRSLEFSGWFPAGGKPCWSPRNRGPTSPRKRTAGSPPKGRLPWKKEIPLLENHPFQVPCVGFGGCNKALLRETKRPISEAGVQSKGGGLVD